jgi:hypothetical protein
MNCLNCVYRKPHPSVMPRWNRRAVLLPSGRCVYRKPHPSVMPGWNHLSWRNDRAALLRSGRPDLAIQVEVAA